MARKVNPIKRETSLMLTLSQKEKNLIRSKAKKMGMTMSGYVRFILLNDEKKEPSND